MDSSLVRTGISDTFTTEKRPSHFPTFSCTSDLEAPSPDFFVELDIQGPEEGSGSVRRLFAADLDLVTRSVVNSAGSVVSSPVDSGDRISFLDISNDWREAENSGHVRPGFSREFGYARERDTERNK